MLLRDVMTRHVEVIHPDATLREAAQKMKTLDVGPVPVCDGERLQGMLTDRDITIRATAEGRDPNTTRVRDVMTPDMVYCFEDQDVREAARIMEERQIRRLVSKDWRRPSPTSYRPRSRSCSSSIVSGPCRLNRGSSLAYRRQTASGPRSTAWPNGPFPRPSSAGTTAKPRGRSFPAQPPLQRHRP